VCALETSWLRRPWPTEGCRAKNKQTKRINHLYNALFNSHFATYKVQDVLMQPACLYSLDRSQQRANSNGIPTILSSLC